MIFLKIFGVYLEELISMSLRLLSSMLVNRMFEVLFSWFVVPNRYSGSISEQLFVTPKAGRYPWPP